jgi:hypothetical protein
VEGDLELRNLLTKRTLEMPVLIHLGKSKLFKNHQKMIGYIHKNLPHKENRVNGRKEIFLPTTSMKMKTATLLPGRTAPP